MTVHRTGGQLVRGFPAPAEVAVDEFVDVAVEHAADVARLDLGAQVLDHLVRLHHVAADLAAPADLGLLAGDRVEFGGTILLGLRGDQRRQPTHRPLAVLQLAALLLRARHEAGRLVDQADGRRRLVDVLTAGARRPEDLHADVGLVDVDVDVVEQRPHLHGGERRLPAALVVERADPHQAVRAPLGGHQAVRVAAGDGDLGRHDARPRRPSDT